MNACASSSTRNGSIGSTPSVTSPHWRILVDRRRAESFGSRAAEYDRHRPRYPNELVAALVDRDGIRVLDVGAGTGIASAQLRAAGADVTAVEPDPRMAKIAADKGIRVEVATFESWQPD